MATSIAIGGGALLAGSVCFLLGAANPRLFAVWTATEEAQLRMIAADPRSWVVTNALFAIATVLTTVGLTVAPDVVGAGGTAIARMAVAGYGLAAVVWLASIVFRLVVTPAAAGTFVQTGVLEAGYQASSRWSGGLFVAFTFIAGSSLVALGISIVAGGALTAVAGWFSIVLGAVMVGGYLAAGDMPPFVAYLPTGALGVAMLLARP
jgi:hypothetical protein